MSGAFAGDQEFKRPFKDGLNEKIDTMSERISKCWEILEYAFLKNIYKHMFAVV